MRRVRACQRSAGLELEEHRWRRCAASMHARGSATDCPVCLREYWIVPALPIRVLGRTVHGQIHPSSHRHRHRSQRKPLPLSAPTLPQLHLDGARPCLAISNPALTLRGVPATPSDLSVLGEAASGETAGFFGAGKYHARSLHAVLSKQATMLRPLYVGERTSYPKMTT